ncbi:hypothetical protein BCR44DRAFT_1425530 [Catenaria anguillulae PL171]|uniref:Uncharacterized protein n=1 Tax=Catenaria anguillulae PL171 TaxID=765915 RepID=A0A1Y2I0I7_9FUNG|nr:hypothetical protein BCR44DRAFT_1425530 [Catenaria anguillulae PL171]
MPASTQCGDAQPGDSRLATPGPSPSICHTSRDHALHGSRQCNASCSHPHVPPPGICQTEYAQGMGGPLQAETVRQRQGGRPGRHLEAQTAARKVT